MINICLYIYIIIYLSTSSWFYEPTAWEQHFLNQQKRWGITFHPFPTWDVPWPAALAAAAPAASPPAAAAWAAAASSPLRGVARCPAPWCGTRPALGATNGPAGRQWGGVVGLYKKKQLCHGISYILYLIQLLINQLCQRTAALEIEVPQNHLSLPDWFSNRVTPEPLGNDAVTWSILNILKVRSKYHGYVSHNQMVTQMLTIQPIQLWPFISYNWLFQWDYTFYKWGFLVLITGISGHNCSINFEYHQHVQFAYTAFEL